MSRPQLANLHFSYTLLHLMNKRVIPKEKMRERERERKKERERENERERERGEERDASLLPFGRHCLCRDQRA